MLRAAVAALETPPARSPRRPYRCRRPGLTLRDFLEAHPEEVRKYAHGHSFKEAGILIISAFLNWPDHRVRYALERLGVIDETVRATRTFLKAHPEERKKILPHGKESIPREDNYFTILDSMNRSTSRRRKRVRFPILTRRSSPELWKNITAEIAVDLYIAREVLSQKRNKCYVSQTMTLYSVCLEILRRPRTSLTVSKTSSSLAICPEFYHSPGPLFQRKKTP
jgi:hypothetical protein